MTLPHAEIKDTLVDIGIDRREIMLPRNPDTDAFWQAFRRHTGLDHDNYVVGSFGDSPAMAAELAELVIAGIKRATASLARDYGDGREPMPKPGDFVMMLDAEGRPRFIWRTTEITIKPLSEVDEPFAWDEGEGTALGTGGWLPIADISVGKQAEKGLSSMTISSPCSSASRSYGRSLVRLLKHQLINPSALCASSGFISRICSSL